MIFDSFYLNYIFLAILLLFSFFFSGSETAFFSLNRLERNSLKENKSIKKKAILSFLLENQEQLLITILTGNMVVNIFASSIGSIIGDRLFRGKSEIYSIIGMTLLLLIFGELTPKRIAVNHSRSFSNLTAKPLYYLHLFLTPVRSVLNHISTWFLNLFPKDMRIENEKKHSLVLTTAEMGYKQSILIHSEYRLFKSYLAFTGKPAYSVMTQRKVLNTISSDLNIGEVLDIIAEDKKYIMNLSIILRNNDSDHLSGWIPIPRLLECKFEQSHLNESIKTLSRDFHIVPKSKDLPTLILEMREDNSELALLVDEFGGTAGVIWFKNIIEDVLRVFYNPIQETQNDNNQGTTVIPASMPIEDFEEYFGVEIDFDVETIAGLFLELFGDIPESGDEVLFHDLHIIVLEMDKNTIKNLKIEKRYRP
ncbi:MULTISPECIES: hemolysin family protein [unclassified Oceanispirochaeta]|uniref:hemolysin family protein n=1 Tax=unclassified Oceanispirochaeta TaxID=2635722 RepID=UPI000E09D1A8|nr:MULTISPECIES: hemolysin family protein [unclassified Oceanispirochaeta]MBF9016743.1 HlyC/CorC family transporter [Oceanispirochaeta sp. M2]NPD72013.1 HlyC/CorC family transporter [Oceanispirochaeta sp. M1]RDG32457.1 HlyC/CorC family transporter [Oceanispirochaeta sp. M1]